MCTVLVTYDPQNRIAQDLMEVLAMTAGVEIDDEVMLMDREPSILNNIKAGLEEVRLFNNGKIETTSAKDFLYEL